MTNTAPRPTLYIRTVANRAGHQIGYEVFNADTGAVVTTYRNKEFGGAAFFRRAMEAAEGYVARNGSPF
jgi:hypothetical protein